MFIDHNGDFYTAVARVDDFIEEVLVGESKESNADGACGFADLSTDVGEGVAARVGKEPEFEELAADFSAEVARGEGLVRGEEFSHGRRVETDDQIIMHFERWGGHVGRADEDERVVKDEDLLMHEARLLDRVDIASLKEGVDFGGASHVVVDFSRDVLLDLFFEGRED